MFKMDRERNEGLVVGGCPGVSRKIQSTLVFLQLQVRDGSVHLK
jgi:hypothetical protein